MGNFKLINIDKLARFKSKLDALLNLKANAQELRDVEEVVEGKYELPEGGIPQSDLSSSVQDKLNIFDYDEEGYLCQII